MKIATALAISLMSVASIGASTLVEKSKKASLEPIPESKTELLKLIDNPDNYITKERVELGKKLFFDPRLSKSGLISCNTCHNLAEGGDDGISAAVGHKWSLNPHHLNSPTVYNSVFFSSQFWDGRDKDLEKQAQGPMLAAPEMAATKEHVEAVVNSMPAYVKEFEYAYGDTNITLESIANAIAVFERTLVTPSRFDDFLNGNVNALDKFEKRGLEIFIDKGCATCHNGVALGGEMQPFEVSAKYKYADIGDFKGNKESLVKTPTLRNITATAPYFHNGAIWSLKEAIVEMGRVQLGIEITDDEANLIESFLKSLDGRIPEITYPQLPASTQNTPQPNIE